MFTVDFRFEENQTTIEFPCNEEFLSAKFDELGVEDKLKTSQYMVGTNYAALKRLVTDFVDADELNFLAKRLDGFDRNELNTFEAVCEARAPRSVAEMINITYNIYNYTLVQDMSSMEIIGKTHFKAVHIGWNPGEMENADLAKIGRELMNSGKGITGAEGSEANMSKQHISFWIKNSNLKECEINMKSIGCNSRSDYIDKAVEFYNGYIHNKNNED